MERLNPLDLIVATHEDARSVMDVLGHDIKHPLHLAVDGLAAGYTRIAISIVATELVDVCFSLTILEHHCHRGTLI